MAFGVYWWLEGEGKGWESDILTWTSMVLSETPSPLQMWPVCVRCLTKPKAGVSTMAFLGIQEEGVWILILFQLPWPFADELLVNEVPGQQLTVWAEIIITLGLLPSLTLSVHLSPGLSENQVAALGHWVKLCYIIAYNFVLDWMVLYFFSQHNLLSNCWNVCLLCLCQVSCFLIKDGYHGPEFFCWYFAP